MLLMGDEVRRSQGGNNNAYCQDNEVGWFNWELVDRNADLLVFVKGLISLIHKYEIFKIEYLLATPEDIEEPHITWHGVKLNQPDWSEDSRSLAFTLLHPSAKEVIHVMVNAYWKGLRYQVPDPKGKHWYKVVDTSLEAPDDLIMAGHGQPCKNKYIRVPDRSITILIAQ
jgi:glycogen operon protein